MNDPGSMALERARRYEKAGMTPQAAEAKAVAEVVKMMADDRRANESAARFDASMAQAMGQDVEAGNGADLNNLDGAAAPIVPDRAFGNTAPPKPIGYRTAGPVGPSGVSERGAPMYSQEEARAYSRRKPVRAASQEELEASLAMPGGVRSYGEYLPSEQDQDMYRRGMAPTYNAETGDTGYSVAYPQGDAFVDGIPYGAPGRAGMRPDLRQPVVDYRTGATIPGSHKYEKTTRPGPVGDVEVYAPSPEFREQLDGYDRSRMTLRLAQRAGLSPEEAAALAAAPEDVDLNALRLRGSALREADRQARKDEVVRRAQLRSNPTALLNDDWRQFVIASSLLGEQADMSPSDVEARRNEQSQNEDEPERSPEERRILDAKADEAERQAPVEERAAEFRDAPTIHPTEQQMVDQHVAERYSAQSPLMLWGTTSSFTAREQQETVDWLVNDRGYTEEKARLMVDDVARQRNSQSYWGNWDGLPGWDN